ncbi:hypothetical protein SDC9_205517 [bioreactor metagenome]|uniref:Uncharacterized protein n=1 Tax=bioreactor metagenome TaxID=1076179 RepID=A0A645JE43_9ZZZZ
MLLNDIRYIKDRKVDVSVFPIMFIPSTCLSKIVHIKNVSEDITVWIKIL